MIVSLNHERVTIVFFYRRKHVSGEKVEIIAATLSTEPAWQNLDLHCRMWKTYIQKVTSGETTFCNGFPKKVILFYKSSFYNIEKLQLWLIFFIIDFYWLKSCQSQGATEIPRSLRPF